jgi:hypothetical protein
MLNGVVATCRYFLTRIDPEDQAPKIDFQSSKGASLDGKPAARRKVVSWRGGGHVHNETRCFHLTIIKIKGNFATQKEHGLLNLPLLDFWTIPKICGKCHNIFGRTTPQVFSRPEINQYLRQFGTKRRP